MFGTIDLIYTWSPLLELSFCVGMPLYALGPDGCACVWQVRSGEAQLPGQAAGAASDAAGAGNAAGAGPVIRPASITIPTECLQV